MHVGFIAPAGDEASRVDLSTTTQFPKRCRADVYAEYGRGAEEAELARIADGGDVRLARGMCINATSGDAEHLQGSSPAPQGDERNGGQ